MNRLGRRRIEAETPVIRTLIGGLVMLAAPVKVWDGVSKAIGTYSIDTSAAGLPVGVKACLVYAGAQWAAASNSNTLSVRPTGGTADALGLIALVAGANVRAQGIVPCDSSGDFDAIVAGATSNPSYLWIWGYLQ